MAIINLYFDTRRAKNGAPAHLKISINKRGQTAYIGTGIKLQPYQWNNMSRQVIDHPNKTTLNAIISKKYSDVNMIYLRLSDSGNLAGKTAAEIKRIIESELDPEKSRKEDIAELFMPYFEKFIDTKNNSGTHSVYIQTLRRLRAFDPDIDKVKFTDITKSWLTRFEAFMAQTASKNARNIHLRNIRAAFNSAIDEEITTFYPFRKFPIRPQQTAKRSLSAQELRTIFNYEVEIHLQPYADMFRLIFCLIGINTADLYNLTHVQQGRIEFNRAKTHRLYSIKVEPEAADIINKYRGGQRLISVAERYADKNDFSKHINRALQKIGPVTIGKRGAKTYAPLFPHLTTYWARHSWATIAAELDIPKETIAAALGHGGNSVTDVYIRFDDRKIDEANRRVLDYVFYDKK